MLLLDGHVSHCVAETVDICTENNIRTVLLPVQTSHVLQPLDVLDCFSFTNQHGEGAQQTLHCVI